jgi:hypothetical protein
MLMVLENRMLRKTFKPKKDKVKEKQRRIYKEEFYDVYCWPYIIQVIKSI